MPLFEDVNVINRAIGWLNDAASGGIKAQTAMLNEQRKMANFHLIKGGVLQQKLHRALNVLHDGSFASFGESFVHPVRSPWRGSLGDCADYLSMTR